MRVRGSLAAVALAAVAGSADAQEAAAVPEPSASEPIELRLLPPPGHPGGQLVGANAAAWPNVSAIPPSAPRLAGLDLRRVSVVEIAPQGALGAPPKRSHHALSFGSDMVRDAVRAVGVDASDCAAQFRMPSRLRQSMVAGDAAAFDVQAQIRLACRF